MTCLDPKQPRPDSKVGHGDGEIFGKEVVGAGPQYGDPAILGVIQGALK